MNEKELCESCKKELKGEELDFAKNPANHPGILGLVCQKCYDESCKESPDLPWTDPISGEVDYDEMAEDLGCPEIGDNYDGEDFDY